MNVSRAVGLDQGGSAVDLAESVMALGRIWAASGVDLGWIWGGSAWIWVDLSRSGSIWMDPGWIWVDMEWIWVDPGWI